MRGSNIDESPPAGRQRPTYSLIRGLDDIAYCSAAKGLRARSAAATRVPADARRAIQAGAKFGTIMKRRQFLAAIGGGVGAISMPAVAQTTPQVRWRLTASWPKSLDTLYGACEVFAKRVSEITD